MKRKAQDPRVSQLVLKMVAEHYKTTQDEIRKGEGDRTPRKVVMYILKNELGATASVAQEACGAKHATDVYLAAKAVMKLLQTDKDLEKKIEEIKTESLILTTMSESGAESNGEPTIFKRQIVDPTIETDTLQIVNKVRKAVTSIFLGADLLQTRDPAGEVLLAKDTVVFLVWDDFPKITQAEILAAFHLDREGFYRAIGRISVGLKEDGKDLKKKLKAVRAAYSPA